ncbi:MAG: DUF401 family protein [Ignisphaera sp.]
MSLTIILFIISTLLAFILILYGFNIAIAIGLAILVYSLPLQGLEIIEIIKDSFNLILLNTVLSLILAMFLADLFRSSGIGNKMVASLESLSPRLAAFSVPAIIGLLPMPAGAYISATIIDPLYTNCKLGSEDKTFLNYWFRHVWVTVWPLYQVVILASAILNMSFNDILYYNWPIFVGALTSGLIKSMPIMLAFSGNCIKREKHRSYSGLLYLWPFIVIAILVMVVKMPLPLSLITTIILFIAIHKPSKYAIKNGLKYSIDPTITMLIIESLIFSNVIERSGLSNQLAQHLYRYADIAVFAIPFLMVIATGFEFTFATLAFPSILPLLKGYRITLAFLGGFTGAMLSPSHACFVLSAKYFKSSLVSVYIKHLIQSIVLTIIITLSITILLMI